MILCEDILEGKLGKKFQTVVESSYEENNFISRIKTLNEDGEVLAEH